MADEQDDAFARAVRFIAEAEQRRDHQATVVADPQGSPEVAIADRHILAEMERTLQLARLYRDHLRDIAEAGSVQAPRSE